MFRKILISMKKSSSLIVLIFLYLYVNAFQNNDTINRVDENNLQQGCWIIYKENEKKRVVSDEVNKIK